MVTTEELGSSLAAAGSGGTEELDLLTPGEVAAGHDLAPSADRGTVAGRDCTVFAMITGGDRFRLSVDDETMEFTDIEFDVPLADDLFAPIAGTPSW